MGGYFRIQIQIRNSLVHTFHKLCLDMQISTELMGAIISCAFVLLPTVEVIISHTKTEPKDMSRRSKRGVLIKKEEETWIDHEKPLLNMQQENMPRFIDNTKVQRNLKIKSMHSWHVPLSPSHVNKDS